MSNFYTSNQQSGGGGFYNQQSHDAYGEQQPFGGYSNPNTAQQQQQQQQWQSSTQQQSQQQATSQPQQQQPQNESTGTPFWNPSMAMAAVAGSMANSGPGFSNDAMLDFASTAGKTFLQGGSARMIPGLESAMLTLRSYFAVDNKYVLTKMKKILVPFLSKQWRRQVSKGKKYDSRFFGYRYS